MNRGSMGDAREAAERFINALDRLEEREETDDYFRRYMNIIGFKETAAVRRASLDLSRALTEMRRPG